MDPDYNQVASGNFSLSDAGGTYATNGQSLAGFSRAGISAFGSVAPSAAPFGEMGFGGGASSAEGGYGGGHGDGGNAVGALLASPAAARGKSGSGSGAGEVVLEIVAPPGKLGLVIDCPAGAGAPVVHAIKDTCPIRDDIYVGDGLVAVDDVDVREMNAVEVSRLINKKSGQVGGRKLTIRRTPRGRDGMY